MGISGGRFSGVYVFESWKIKMPYINTRRSQGNRKATTVGMGAAAGCPSLSQLMGITDPTDPCQNTAANGDTLVTPSSSSVLACMAGDIPVQMANGAWGCQAGPAIGAGNNIASAAISFLKANPLVVAAAAAALFLLGGKRRQ